MAWLYLGLAGLLESAWVFAMKQSLGMTRALPTLVMLLSMGASFGLLALAMRELPLGVAYTVWTGIGAVGTLVVGAVFLGEVLTPARILAASLISAGMITMKMTSS